METTLKVASRTVLAALAVGKTFQNEKIRIHRYRDALVVTELENAGRRGKKVREAVISPSSSYDGDESKWFDRISGEFVTKATASSPYDSILGLIRDLLVDYPGEINISERALRGVDVEPFGETFNFVVKKDGPGSIQVRYSPTDFSVKDTAEMERPNGRFVKQETFYSPKKKQDAMAFYAWASKNQLLLRRFKSMNDFRSLWGTLGVKYDYH